MRGVFLILLSFSGLLWAQPIKREVLGLYRGGGDGAGNAYTEIHRILEMPLNHNGLFLSFHDIRKPLPAPDDLNRYRGLVIALEGARPDDPRAWLSFLEAASAKGLQIFISGDLGIDEEKHPRLVSRHRDIWRYLGLRYTGQWNRYTYNIKVRDNDRLITNFERDYAGVLPPFHRIHPFDRNLHLIATARPSQADAEDMVLAASHPNGGYVAAGYLYYGDDRTRRLYLNPFRFLERAFKTENLPKPDPATLVGRRIFYSHIDGDGWNNLTEIAPYNQKRTISAQVVLDELIKPYPDLPVTVAPIAGDLDPNWFGRKDSVEVARDIFNLDHVEAASHTYSHPLSWYFFAPQDPKRESAYLPLYSKVRWRDQADPMTRKEAEAQREAFAQLNYMEGYTVPRAYAVKPFDLDLEIKGGVDYIQQFLPPGKSVNLVQWSGDTTVFPAALKMTRDLGLRNINGGDTRFDREFPSYCWVAPVGRDTGGGRQIYASNSNENTYTDLWTGRFFGFKFLVKTIRNTETPLRIKPLNIYYHMYSGEKISSRNAVIQNLEYARTQKVVPIMTSRFAAVGDGFFSTTLDRRGPQQFAIANRDGLQTIRFDRASNTRLDLSASTGVMGQIHYQGALYIALDPTVPEALITLTDHQPLGALPSSTTPYLIESRWLLNTWRATPTGFTTNAAGYGKGTMRFYVPKDGRYKITVKRGQRTIYEAIQTSKANELKLNLPPQVGKEVNLTVAKQ